MKRWLIFILLFSSLYSSAQNPDINLLKKINVGREKSLDPAFRFISDSETPIVIGVPVGFMVATLFKKDSAFKLKAYTITTTVVMAAVISTSLKYGINRERPFDKYPVIDRAISVHTASFPSGHTSAAFSLATSLSITCPKWYIIAPSFLWAGSVAYSRMHLGVHYPTDVLGGAIIGTGSAFLSWKLNKWLISKKRKK